MSIDQNHENAPSPFQLAVSEQFSGFENTAASLVIDRGVIGAMETYLAVVAAESDYQQSFVVRDRLATEVVKAEYLNGIRLRGTQLGQELAQRAFASITSRPIAA